MFGERISACASAVAAALLATAMLAAPALGLEAGGEPATAAEGTPAAQSSPAPCTTPESTQGKAGALAAESRTGEARQEQGGLDDKAAAADRDPAAGGGAGEPACPDAHPGAGGAASAPAPEEDGASMPSASREDGAENREKADAPCAEPAAAQPPAASAAKGGACAQPAGKGASPSPQKPSGPAKPAAAAPAAKPAITAQASPAKAKAPTSAKSAKAQAKVKAKEPAAAKGGASSQQGPAAAIAQPTVATIGSASAKGCNVDIPAGTPKANTAATLYRANSTPAQRFRIVPIAKTGLSVVYNVASNLALGISGKARDGAIVRQSAYKGSASQKWAVSRNQDGTYRFSAALRDAQGKQLVLDAGAASRAVGSSALAVKRANGSKAQEWRIASTRPVADGTYVIHSGMGGGKALDVHGCSKATGANVEIYAQNHSKAQVFDISYEQSSGYYLITNVNSGKRVAVGADSGAAGANVQQSSKSRSWSQRWAAVPAGKDGSLRFVNAGSNLSLDVAGASGKDCTSVIQWAAHNGSNQKWRLEQLPSFRANVAAEGGAGSVRTKRLGNGDTYLLLPSYADLRKLRLTPTGSNPSFLYSASKGGAYKKGSPSTTVDLGACPTDAQGARLLYVKQDAANLPSLLKVVKSAKVRTLYLVSDNPAKRGRAYVEASKDHSAKATGKMTLVGANGKVTYKGRLEQIKGRGNSTWQAAKKPYQIKLAKKESLLDGSKGNKAKTWVLLANAYDDTMMRNYLSLKTARAIGMECAPDCEFVDLYYDGDYRGNYLLCEKVQVKKGRVEISEIENASTDNKDISTHKTAVAKNRYGMEYQYVTGVRQPKDITGGYLVELDNWYYHEERSWFRTSAGYFVVKSPEDASKAEMKYISERLQAAMNASRKPDGNASAHFDLVSLAQAHLVNEFAKNPDYVRASSTYFYVDKGERLIHAGPVWDFDIDYGVHQDLDRSYMDPRGWASRGYNDFYAKNRQFNAALRKVYAKSFLPQARGLFGASGKSSLKAISAVEESIAASVKMERIFHPGEVASFESMSTRSWRTAAAYLKEWAALRLNWMNSAIVGGKAPIAIAAGVKGGTYRIQSALGKTLDIEGASRADGANALLYRANGGANQKFRISAAGKASTGETFYSIVAAHSGKALAVNARGNAVQASRSASSAQRWVFRRWPAGNASYCLVNLANGKVLDVEGASKANGANALAWSLNGGANQVWRLRRV